MPQDREIAALFKLVEDDDSWVAEAAWSAVLERADRARTALAAVADGMDADGTRARQLLEDLRRREILAELDAAWSRPEGDIDLEAGALAIARFGDPGADADAARQQLDDLARRVGSLPPASEGPLPQLQALGRHMAGARGFRCERGKHTEPADAYLPRVLQYRRGLPVAVAVVWILVGRRLGATVHGIGLPNHFLGAWDANGRRVFFDPADAGRALSRGECARLLSQAGMAWSETLLAPVSTRLVLVRLLNALIRIDERRGGPASPEAAWWERLRALLLDNAGPGEVAGGGRPRPKRS